MADNIINVKIRDAYDTEANWMENNPTLLQGQVAISSDKHGMYKVGDGTKTWSQLDYASHPASQLETARNIDGVRFDGTSNIIHYGECSTAASTATKVVSCTNFTLETGAVIYVRFTVTNTATAGDLQLNVNSTGAKGIKYRNANLPSAGDLAAGRTYCFVYDGTYWQWVGDRNTNDNNYVRQENITSDADRSLLLSYNAASTTSTATNRVYKNSSIYANPQTGKITATGFIGNLEGQADRVNNHTVESDVPSDAKFTDTNDLTQMNGVLPISLGGTGATSSLVATQNLGTFSNQSGNSGGTEIPENSDLNTYTTPGTYYSPNNTRTSTLTNAPSVSAGFKLFVDGNYSSSYVHQYAITATTQIMHRQRKSNGTWSDWAKIFDTINLPTKSDVGLSEVENKSSATIRDEITQSNVTTALGYTPLNKAGDSMSGALTMAANQYYYQSKYALHMNNQDIIGVNSIYTSDASANQSEGIHFYRSSGKWDDIWAADGVLYFSPNAPTSGTSAADSQHVARFTTAPPGENKVVLTSDANGGIKYMDALPRQYVGTTSDGYANGLDPMSRALVSTAASNKTFGLPASSITIEYSTDGGSTWTDYGATDTEKISLFSELRTFTPRLGKASTTAANQTNCQLRVTITPTDGRYVAVDSVYVWGSTNGNTWYMDLDASTVADKDTFTNIFTGHKLEGWSGNNIKYFTGFLLDGRSSGTASNKYKLRLTFRQTAIRTSGNYGAPTVYDIRFYGDAFHVTPQGAAAQNIIKSNHIYSWDASFNTVFPRRIQSGTGSDKFENSIDVISNSGRIQMYSTGNTNGDGNRGIWVGAHGTGDSKTIISVDTNNNVTFTGSLSGNATSATTAINASMSDTLKSVQLTNEDLNTLIPSNTTTYYAGGQNEVTNSPLSSGTAFGLVTYRNASGFRTQVLTSNVGTIYQRNYTSNAWGSWTQWKLTDTTYTAGTGLSLSGTTFSNAGVTGIKGDNESSYRTGNVNLTKANIGLGNVDNTADADKSVASAVTLTSTLPVSLGGTNSTSITGAANTLQVPTLGHGTEITSGTNLDSLMTVGSYYCNTTAISKTLTGTLPVAQNQMQAFLMNVGYALGTNYAYQEIRFFAGRVFYRYNTTKTDTTKWNAWYERTGLASLSGTLGIGHGGTGATDALTAITNLGGLSAAQIGTAIPSNADLDTYTTPGTYHSKSGDISATLSNPPLTSSGFKLYVSKVYTDKRILQVAVVGIGQTVYFWRYSTDTGVTWSDWAKPVKVSASAVGSSKQPVYVDSSGSVSAISYTVESNVPSGAVFTDTTYDVATQSTNGLMSSADKASLDSLSTVVTVPMIAFSSLPSGNSGFETYFNEWLEYISDNYQDLILSQKVIVAPVYPNIRGWVVGYVYGTGDGGEINSTTKIPKYCHFVFYSGYQVTRCEFGSSNGVYFYKDIQNQYGANLFNVLKTGDTITGDLKINTKGKGFFLTDKNSFSYPGVYDNGSDLWIGSVSSGSTHHSGGTYISSGYNGTKGNATIYVAVPNASNNNSQLYGVYHTGNKPSKSDVGLGSVDNKSSATIRSEITSSNVTSALGFTPVSLDGAQTITGSKHINSNMFFVHSDLTKGTAPQANQYREIRCLDQSADEVFANGKRTGAIGFTTTTSNENQVAMTVYKPTAGSNDNAVIAVCYNTSGAYTKTITPVATDNSTKIATTAYVKGLLRSGTAAATTTNCPNGCFYFQYV